MLSIVYMQQDYLCARDDAILSQHEAYTERFLEEIAEQRTAPKVMKVHYTQNHLLMPFGCVPYERIMKFRLALAHPTMLCIRLVQLASYIVLGACEHRHKQKAATDGTSEHTQVAGTYMHSGRYMVRR